MRVLVTGGAGFIGRHLVRTLAENGHEVCVFDNLRRGSREAVDRLEAQFILGDVRDRPALAAAMRGMEVVYHLAAQSNVLGAVSDIDYSFSSNVIGTYNVLAVARDVHVRRVIFTSSREVYGEVQNLPVSEDRNLNPKNAYGASKAAGEMYCRTFHAAYGVDVSVVRLSNVYGPEDRDRVIPIWLERARRGLNLELYGGSQVLDFVPIHLVVEGLHRAASLALYQQPVNIASGVGITLHQLAGRVSSLFSPAVNFDIMPARPQEVTRFVADVSRMRSLLGIHPPTDPLAGLTSLGQRTAPRAAVPLTSMVTR